MKTWPKQLLGSLPLVIALPGKLNMVLMPYYKKISSWVIDIKAVKAPYCHLYYETIDNCFSHKKLTKNYDCLLVSSAISNIVSKFWMKGKCQLDDKLVKFFFLTTFQNYLGLESSAQKVLLRSWPTTVSSAQIDF